MTTSRDTSNNLAAEYPVSLEGDVDDRPSEAADPAIAAAVARARVQIARKEFATENEVQAAYDRAGI